MHVDAILVGCLRISVSLSRLKAKDIISTIGQCFYFLHLIVDGNFCISISPFVVNKGSLKFEILCRPE